MGSIGDSIGSWPSTIIRSESALSSVAVPFVAASVEFVVVELESVVVVLASVVCKFCKMSMK